MPCNYSEYPDNWRWLSRQIIADAGNKCELCYAPNGALICREKHNLYPWRLATGIDKIDFKDGRQPKITKVVLTVHHIDSDKTNSTKQNLLACCQRCHLRLDLHKHMTNRAKKNKPQQQRLEV